jgi:hypothetical protein
MTGIIVGRQEEYFKIVARRLCPVAGPPARSEINPLEILR